VVRPGVRRTWALAATLGLVALSCGDDETHPVDDASTRADSGGDIDGGPDGGGVDGATSTDGGGGGGDGGGIGGAAYRGEVFFVEHFEDGDYAANDWYDDASPVLSAEHAPAVAGGAQSFECRFAPGATTCPGRPGRHTIPDAESVYLSYWVKYSASWIGSGRAYHPHEFHFLTNMDGMWVGPAHTHLTLYIEHVGLTARLALQDSANEDLGCILRNDDSFVGCGGDFATYPFTEMRSVASCNGLAGDVDGRDCFANGDGTWYSARFWDGSRPSFTDANKTEWHFVESYWRMNTISGGVGAPDGAIRYWVDGAELVAHDHILMRTAANTDQRFNQFLDGHYIGDGSPVDQSLYIDELTVARGVP